MSGRYYNYSPVLPFSIWRYKGRHLMVLSSKVTGKDIWEIEASDTDHNVEIFEVCAEDWMEKAHLIGN